MAEILVVKEKLRRLQESAEWDESMKGLFALWENQLDSVQDTDESFYRLPKVVTLASDLEDRLRFVNGELQNNRKLSTEQRNVLFGLKDILEIELSCFSYTDLAGQIEKSVDFELEVFEKEKEPIAQENT